MRHDAHPTFLRDHVGGVELSVRVVPRASRNEVSGEHDGALKIRLTAPPVEGKANKALIEFLAKTLGVPRGQVSLVAGDTSRAKRIRVAGITARTALKALGIGQIVASRPEIH